VCIYIIYHAEDAHLRSVAKFSYIV